MTGIAHRDSPTERLLSILTLGVFWASFGLLASGLALWLASVGGNASGSLLNAGLMGLFVMPGLRLAMAIATAVRMRDWLLFGATLAVVVILLALTVRDAAGW